MKVKCWQIIVLGLIMLLLVSFIPVGVNKLMNSVASPIFASNGVETSNDWIGFMGSFLGSLLAGLLTLGGVYLTIKEQRYTQMLDRYPKMLIKIDELHRMLHSKEILGAIKSEEDSHFLILDGFEKLKAKRSQLLELASEINADIYEAIRRICDNTDEMLVEFSSIRQNRLLIEDMNKEVVQKENVRLTKDIQKRVINILANIEVFDEKYEHFKENYSKLFEDKKQVKKRKNYKRKKEEL